MSRRIWSAVNASTPNIRWRITFAFPRTRTILPPEFVFQPRIHPLHRRPFVMPHRRGGLVTQQPQPFLFRLNLHLGRRIPAGIGIDDRHMPQPAAVLVDRLGIVGRVHQVVQVDDPAGA